MDNSNFIFLKEDSKYFYEKCCQVDLLIGMGLYEKAIASSRKIIECIVNPKDEMKLLKFLQINKDKFSKTTLDYLHDIRKMGNDAVHPNEYEWTKDCADEIARKLHHVAVVELYKKRFHHEKWVDNYVPITEDDEWYLNNRFDANLIKKVIKSADEDFIELTIKEHVDKNINELKEELSQEFDEIIKSSMENDEKTLFEPDDDQRDAINYWDEENNNLIIKAGPGSGKTTVLIERVKFLINEKGVAPDSILLITFTEKAANELRERLCGSDGLEQVAIDKIHVSTIHGFCRTVLKKYLFSGLEIIDDDNNEKKVMFIKNHRERLGLNDKYGYVPNDELKFVARKFDEIDSFKVNPDDLIDYLENKLKIGSRADEKYKKAVDDKTLEGVFPKDSLKDKHLKKWKNYKFLTIAKAYKEYKELLKEKNVYDFSRLQTETRNYLMENRDKIGFKNILIDEFQDTDNIQMEIFNLLKENSQSVTYVGDQDQSIFSWRGSNPEFFEEYYKKDDFYQIQLKKNYRSPKNIVDFNEYFMSKQRGSTPINFRVKNEGYGDLFYIKNDDALEEVESIVEIIKFLRDNDRINSLSDIAIISNSVVYKEELFNTLKKNEIHYTIKGEKDMGNAPEVKGILTLIGYLTESMDNEVINLKTLCDDEVNKEMFKFREETLKVLNDCKDYHEFSTLSQSQLNELGIHENDLKFFTDLNQFKTSLNNDKNELTILDVYYRLLEIIDYVETKYEILSSGEEKSIKSKQLHNLSLISHKINSYMDMNEKDDLNGLFEYLIENYQDFSSPLNDFKEENRVHILTAYKAKGLEFPFVIVCSLSDEDFPKERFTSKSYKIPFNFLYPEKCNDIKATLDLHQIEKKHLLEEQMRVLYVALTRAENSLILSTKGNSGIVNELSKFDGIKELTKDTLNKIKYFADEPEEKNTDLVSLSFTSIENYNKCSHLYNLAYNYNFVSPQNESMLIGSVAHNCLDAINTFAASGEINDKLVEDIINTARESNISLESNEKFNDILESVDNYYHDYVKNNEWKVLESEYPFTIYKNKNKIKYDVTGKIDLIIQEDADDDLKISLVDYKSSADMDNVDYLKQLHIYAMAMEYDSQFEDKYIENLIIYSILDDDYEDGEFDIDRKNKLEKEMYDIANSISHYKYSKTKNKSKCKFCSFKGFCK